MTPVRWGILGVSVHYRLRVHNPLQTAEGVQLTGIASRSLDRAREAAERFGIPKFYGSYEELLEDPEIEAVYIPLPNTMHTEWVRKAADHGKHILCEKPFSMSAEETERTIAYAREKGVKVMEAFMYKLHPQWRHAKALVGAGEIGEVQAVHVFFGYNNPDPTNIRNQLEMGGGAVPDIGCYAVSSSRLMMGKEPKRVVSLITRDPELGTDVLSSAILDFGGGARANITVGTQVFLQQHVQVFGSAGYLSIEVPFNTFPDVPGRVTVINGIGKRVVETEVNDMYRIEFEEFSRAVRKGTPVPVDPADAVANQKVLDALYASEEKGGWVEV